ncbi:DUF418 domain-containing protein [Corynebacterium hylobatis]|uniref:DUF418 domain-containing protein n=1 Tax=Corynebacterium hylobatis TaxID=1859290 RepID=A0A430HVP4_9CORY|nr:DUF418 domain-containing protein [Corynebacterium hylobatis]RSZ61660.1 DUF418 domain-containing protein [Corynebacterium hylobatis]
MSTAPSTRYLAPSTRYLAPDIARGVALLGIALANIPTGWIISPGADYAADFGGVRDPGSRVDDLVVVLHAMFVHVRGLPMFTMLLGFGIGLLAQSLLRRGLPRQRVQRLLWRRYLLLGVIGVLHLVLLFSGDIIAQYAVTALVLIALIPLRDRILLVIAWLLLGLTISFFSFTAMVAALQPEVMVVVGGGAGAGQAETYLGYVATNLAIRGGNLAVEPVTVLMLLPLMIFGLVWARRGVLTDVAAHRTLLRTWVVVAGLVVLGIGLPWGLAAIGVLSPALEVPLDSLNTGFGMLTGPGILALIALLFPGTEKQMNPWTRPFVALGRRSMSGYILQSVLFLLLTQPFTLDLGPQLGIPGQMALGVGVWAVTVVWALVWDLRGWPGPVERVHRRLAYGRSALP